MDWGFLKYYVQEIREKGKMLYGCVPDEKSNSFISNTFNGRSVR